MPKLSQYLRRLEHELLALDDDAMLLEELDGFIAGLLVCPEFIMPGEWLPVVWGKVDGDKPGFDSLEHLNPIISLVMEHYNGVARILIEQPDYYVPLFSVDERNCNIIWELWIEGFEQAVKLRPAAWQQFLIADRETARAISGLLTLVDVARRNACGFDEQADTLTVSAPDQIGLCIVALNRWRLANYGPAQMLASLASTAKSNIGYNQPCPCGSGKKYKKCCSLN